MHWLDECFEHRHRAVTFRRVAVAGNYAAHRHNATLAQGAAAMADVPLLSVADGETFT
jgi:hypothetical protein